MEPIGTSRGVASLKTGWKYIFWTVVGAAATAGIDAIVKAAGGYIPVVFLPYIAGTLAAIGKSIATYCTVQAGSL